MAGHISIHSAVRRRHHRAAPARTVQIPPSAQGIWVSPRSSAAARSAMATTGAAVWPPGMPGTTEASTTRRPSMPCTRSCVSTTLVPSLGPICEQEQGANAFSDGHAFGWLHLAGAE